MKHTRRAPRPFIVLVAAFLALQIMVARLHDRPTATAQSLPAPPSDQVLRLVALGEPMVLGQLLTLWLQAFDNQPGISIPFVQLDYDRVEAWLDRLLNLDPKAQYPLMMASQLYGQIPDLDKDRKMLEFVYRRFLEDPNLRWQWLGHAAIMAKHRLKDTRLALHYAQALATRVTDPKVPSWARQMRIFLLEDLGEVETAKILLGGLLASGQIPDDHVKHFLIERLNALQQGEISSNSTNSRP